MLLLRFMKYYKYITREMSKNILVEKDNSTNINISIQMNIIHFWNIFTEIKSLIK